MERHQQTDAMAAIEAAISAVKKQMQQQTVQKLMQQQSRRKQVMQQSMREQMPQQSVQGQFSKVAHIDYAKTFYVHVDTATGNSIGAVLYQQDDTGAKVPLMYRSRKLTDGERNYSPTDAEMAGIHWAIVHAFSDIIEYAPIVVVTDHKNLLTTCGVDTATSVRRLKWAFNLCRFNIVDTVHMAGEELVDADTLSRADKYDGRHKFYVGATKSRCIVAALIRNVETQRSDKS